MTMPLDDPLDGWTLEAEFSLEDGEVVHGPVTLTPSERLPLGTLSVAAMKRLNLADVMGALWDGLGELQRVGVEDSEGWLDAIAAGRRPGVRGRDPRFYLLWAVRRVKAEEAAPGRGTAHLVETFSRPPHRYSAAAIKKYLWVAREKGLLKGSGPDVALTAQAKRMIKKEALDGEH